MERAFLVGRGGVAGASMAVVLFSVFALLFPPSIALAQPVAIVGGACGAIVSLKSQIDHHYSR